MLRLKDLIQIRIRSGISQKELAEYLDFSRPFVSMVESGKRDIPKDKRKEWEQAVMVLRSEKIKELNKKLQEMIKEESK
ncbi:Helix-turn-helix domain-containing protein [Dethiosulfatibacter aminovorans DSM 17477]|uniref:Helix-turn-helix domain-containing protein n=1 Tax=Dethiosulfatibacter aminovorans DSM 17477 TaxID=1121476 RepID=A0A1M6FZQ7_9FIRM|nr:helix-turn-helix transcriptional regulator [Dethiosulfatibacter aminovorans]SHJ03183.1 Helix-turn-helix domain-containing protein [Dethiosulfatibacter aminovorans DSM 17477]